MNSSTRTPGPLIVELRLTVSSAASWAAKKRFPVVASNLLESTSPVPVMVKVKAPIAASELVTCEHSKEVGVLCEYSVRLDGLWIKGRVG